MARALDLAARQWPREPHHQAADAYLRDSAGERLLIHSLNLAEILIGGVRAGRGQEMLSDLHAMGIHVADSEAVQSRRSRSVRLRTASGETAT